MSNDYNRGFTDIAFSCALYYQQNKHRSLGELKSGAHFKNTTKALSRFYRVLAKIEEETLNGWYADTTNAGWLVHNKHPTFVRVPVHLAALFPTSQYLDDLFEISSQIKTSERSILCLSGSNSAKKIFDLVDDVDFCEYLPFEEDVIKEDILRKVSATRGPICLGIRVNSEKYELPFTDLKAIKAELKNVDPAVEECATLKIDYIVRMRAKRVYDASNVIIACDEQLNSTGFSSTFAHQEVHISPSDEVPNKLDDVMELGRYINWLLSQVKIYMEQENIPKMLKRALSLTRVCWMRDYSEEIEDFFSATTFLVERELQTINDLKQKVAQIQPASDWQSVRDELEFFEKVSKLEEQKLKLFEEKKFPVGARNQHAISLAARVLEDCAKHSRGAISI